MLSFWPSVLLLIQRSGQVIVEMAHNPVSQTTPSWHLTIGIRGLKSHTQTLQNEQKWSWAFFLIQYQMKPMIINPFDSLLNICICQQLQVFFSSKLYWFYNQKIVTGIYLKWTHFIISIASNTWGLDRQTRLGWGWDGRLIRHHYLGENPKISLEFGIWRCKVLCIS